MSNTDLMNYLKKVQNSLLLRTLSKIPKDDTEAMNAFNDWRHAIDLLWTNPYNPLLDQAVQANLAHLLEILKKRGVTSF